MTSGPTSSISGTPRDQDLRAEVRVAPADARRRVDHRDRLTGDQRLGGDPVEVEVVDDRDVARAQPLGEVLGPRVEPGDAGHPGRPRLAGCRRRRGTRITAHPATQRPAAATRRAQRAVRTGRRPSSSSAWACAARDSSRPASMRDSSCTRPAPSSRARRSRSTRAVLGLGHHQVPVGERRDLRQVGHDEHLRGLGQPGQPPADLDRRPATDPGVHLVEHEGRDRVDAGQDHLDRQHHPGQLAAGGAARQRPGRRAGCGRAGARPRRRRAAEGDPAAVGQHQPDSSRRRRPARAGSRRPRAGRAASPARPARPTSSPAGPRPPARAR